MHEDNSDINADVYNSIVAACTHDSLLAISARVGSTRLSLAVDTGASVNVLSDTAYQALKRNTRGGRHPLQACDLNLCGVDGNALHVQGKVSLPILIGKGNPPIRVAFYVVANFQLATDGLLGLASLRDHNMTICPGSHTISYRRSNLPLLSPPRSLIVQAVKRKSPTVSSPILPIISPASPVSPWKVVKVMTATACTIPPQTAMNIQVKIPAASIDSDVCLGFSGKLHRVGVESTLSRIQNDNCAVGLAVNQTGAEIHLKQGLYICDALAYQCQVTPEALKLPRVDVGCVMRSRDTEVGLDPTLNSAVTVIDYPTLKGPLLSLLSEFRQVIALKGEPLGLAKDVSHVINLKPGTRPIYVPAYRLPHSQREIVQGQVEDMLKQGVVVENASGWNSPIFVVPKRDGGLRPVIDYRKINAATEDDKFPLPVLSDLLMSLGEGNRYFTSLDMLSGYWQIPVAKESQDITAFSTPHGHYNFVRMPFGLKNAPCTFQRYMNNLFKDMIGHSVYIYLDDVIIASKNSTDHFTALRAVLERLDRAGLRLNMGKCEFLKSRITFLGHRVDNEGIHTLDDKIAAVKNFPRPDSVERVRSFLGLAGYYRAFVARFAHIASPLTQLLKKDRPFTWTDAQENSFQSLKSSLTRAPILVFPNFTKPFELYTDASALGLGAVLMQKGDSSKSHPIAYASRVLTSAEANYSITEQETLGVIWALKHFRDLIKGYPITVYTDHKPMTELFKGRNLSGRLARWYLTIQEYNPSIIFIPGDKNRVADALSRNIPISPISAISTQHEPIDNFSSEGLAKHQREHDVWRKVIYALESGDVIDIPSLIIPFKEFFLAENNVLCRQASNTRNSPIQWVIPESLVPIVLKLKHDHSSAGHPGRDRTLREIKKLYYWPRLKVDVEAYLSNCLVCARNKGSVKRPLPMLTYPMPTRPWDVVAIDLLQMPRSHQGSGYVLTCVDHFSRYAILVALRDKQAATVARALIDNLICPFSAPRVLLSDNGSEFRNELIAEICTQFNIKQTFIVAYHSAGNGLAERCNQKALTVLRTTLRGLLDAWEDHLPQVAACINSSVCESTGHTPHYILYGIEKRFPYECLEKPRSPVYNIDDYSASQMSNLAHIHRSVRENLQQSRTEMVTKQHKTASPSKLKSGDVVMVQLPKRETKLSPKFVGPRLVLHNCAGNINKWVVWDPLLGTTDMIHAERLKLTKISDSTLFAQNPSSGVPPSLGSNSATSSFSPPLSPPSHTYDLRPRPGR